MQQKDMIRTAAGIVAVAVLFGGYQVFKKWTMDPDIGSFESAGMIAAVEYTDDGGRIVLFDADGKKTEAPKWEKGVQDRDPVWRPDGGRIIFVSNRENQSYNIFRWNPAKDKVEQRTKGSISKSSPFFGPPGWPDLMNTGLITTGEAVLDFDQREQRTRRVLPPSSFENADEQATEQMDAAYDRIGTSFKSAKWGPDRKVIFAVMRREVGEVFLINYMVQIGDGPIGPIPMIAGQDIQFDVAPDGTAIVAIKGFEFIDDQNVPPELIKNGRVYKPYRSSLLMIRIGEDGMPEVTPLYSDFPDIGFRPGPLSDAERETHDLPAEIDGLLIDEVGPGTAATVIGMVHGDVLVAINDVPIDSVETMYVILRQHFFGEPVKIDYYAASVDEPGMRTVVYRFGEEDGMALRFPSISPDSTIVAVSLGRTVDAYTFLATELILVPMNEFGFQQSTRLVRGAVYEPSWHPDGRSLVYSKAGLAGDRQIYTINVDGSGEKNVSGVGDFSSPSFSPSTKK
ncbi:MAG: PD40 domain-containing protein [Armatimonadetes bacterium]|nr:PD40 domain-containing protein [Armatimonadota bacterium]